MNICLKFIVLAHLSFISVVILAQKEQGIVYFKSGDIQRGELIESIVGESLLFYFVSEDKASDTVFLEPTFVDRFATTTSSNGKSRKNRVFVTRSTTQGENIFVTPVRDINNLFSHQGKYYLSNDVGNLIVIPENKSQRKEVFSSFLDENLQIFNNSIYSGKLSNYKKIASLQHNFSGRYPGTYFGIRLGYGLFAIDEVVEGNQGITILEEGYTYDFVNRNIGLYLIQSLGKKGNISGQLGVSLGMASGKEHFTPTGRILSYAGQAMSLQIDASIRHYLLRKKVYPFLGIGLQVNNIFDHESLLAVFTENPNNYQSEVIHLESPLNNSTSAQIEAGVEIPIKRQYFLGARLTASQLRDLQNNPLNVFSFQLTINIL